MKQLLYLKIDCPYRFIRQVDLGGAVPFGRRSCPAERRGPGASDVPPFAADVSMGRPAAACPPNVGRLAFEFHARLCNCQPSRSFRRIGSLASHFGKRLAEMSIIIRLHCRIPKIYVPLAMLRCCGAGAVSIYGYRWP